VIYLFSKFVQGVLFYVCNFFFSIFVKKYYFQVIKFHIRSYPSKMGLDHTHVRLGQVNPSQNQVKSIHIQVESSRSRDWAKLTLAHIELSWLSLGRAKLAWA